MGKHTLFPFGAGWLMKYLGGIPINRSKSHNVVNETVRLYRENEEVVVLVPPEGTRSKVTKWKSGFYHIARNANVPILMGYVDGENKEAGFADFFHPTGDMEADMDIIRAFYADKKALLLPTAKRKRRWTCSRGRAAGCRTRIGRSRRYSLYAT
jgi:1-acyl-sn-glycerol-3-phosphate acyltransferase